MTKVLIKKFHKSGSADDPSCYNLVELKVGDSVCFKSDFEQCGKIEKITPADRYSFSRSPTLTLFNPDGFGGDYLRYAQRTTVSADDCWL